MIGPKIFVGVAVAALAAILVGLFLPGPSEVLGPGNPGSSPAQVLPIEVAMGDVTVTKLSERSATIEVSFQVINPNARSVIVQTVDYQLFENSYSEHEPLSGGQLGSRPGGLVEFGSNYFTVLAGSAITLTDTITIPNSGSTNPLWNSLQTDSASWYVSGVVFYSLSSVTSGQENELDFDFAA